MARLFGWGPVGQKVETGLWSLGVVLLILSVLFVPTSGLLADTGGDGLLAGPVCLAKNGCANGCIQLGGGSCSGTGSEGCTKDVQCRSCGCLGCQPTGKLYFCNCQCQSGNAGCQNTTTCNPN